MNPKKKVVEEHCVSCNLSIKLCFCSKVDAFFEKAKGTPRMYLIKGGKGL